MNQTVNEVTASASVDGAQSDTSELHYLTPDEMPFALRLSENLRKFVDAIGRFGSWFFMPLVLITVQKPREKVRASCVSRLGHVIMPPTDQSA